MKKWQKNLMVITNLLGFGDNMKAGKLTSDQQKQISAEYEKKYGVSFHQDKEANEDAEPEETILSEDEQKELAAILYPDGDINAEKEAKVPTTHKGATDALKNKVTTQNEIIDKLQNTTEEDTPINTVQASEIKKSVMPKVLGHTSHTPTHLFGIENKYFARGNWWNDLVATGVGKESYRDEDAHAFRADFNNFREDLKIRCKTLVSTNQIHLLNYEKMILGESHIDYSDMHDKLGEFTVRRFDIIIAYILTLPSVSNIFPVIPNIQNKVEAPTAHFGELSQSYLSGHHFKGSVKLGAEIYHVVDVMFKFMFDNPKQLEKEYIGNMNREGSNPMKWNFFEWCIVHFGTKLHNEQQRRRVIGVTTPRQGDFPQPAMFAADGALRAIERVEEENKVLPFADLTAYVESTILDYVRDFYKRVNELLPSTAMKLMRLYMNEKHKLWYIDAYDVRYGKNSDYTGPKDDIRYFSPENIIWVPNMDLTDYKMWMTRERNVENYELTPFEMYALYFQQDLESLIMCSWWKEGSGVLAPGVQFATKADLVNSKRKLQFLFTNDASTTLAPAATTIDGSLNTIFTTGKNTAATALTGITDVNMERVYKIVCGDIDNPTTISKAGAFAKIKADFEPKAVGDYIKLYAELKEETVTVGDNTYKVVVPTGNLLELERKISA